MSPKRQRLCFLLFGLALLGLSAFLVLSSFRRNIVFFYTLEDLDSRPAPDNEKIRIGGLVKEGSITYDNRSHTLSFIITDTKHALAVRYNGMVPSLFRDGQGVVAEGTLKTPPKENPIFIATQLLAKHDERYMPKEVADQLKKSGHWKYK